VKAKGLWLVTVFLIASQGGLSQPAAPALSIGPEDLRIEQRTDGGYHLYIRKKAGLASILLTESTKDPSHHADNYAYRAAEWNPVNGDEKRILDGSFLKPESKIWSLIDSTPEPDAQFGEAFHIFIPWVVVWGYSWSRQGQTYIHDGTFVNLRAFSLPYADYRGAFQDNPYLVTVTQVPHTPPPETPPTSPKEEGKADLSRYMPSTVDSFKDIASAGKGRAILASGPEDIAPQLASILDASHGRSLDLVICIDTTDSMTDDIAAVKAAVPAIVAKHTEGFASVRVGLVLYKDYFEEYLVKPYPFTADIAAFQAMVNSIRVNGGRDIPEAVYEALFESLKYYPWAADKKIIVLIGDAPPHPLPRGSVDKALVEKAAAVKDVELDTIILPN
jgi:hypothetical protein